MSLACAYYPSRKNCIGGKTRGLHLAQAFSVYCPVSGIAPSVDKVSRNSEQFEAMSAKVSGAWVICNFPPLSFIVTVETSVRSIGTTSFLNVGPRFPQLFVALIVLTTKYSDGDVL
jgi:hypothetical protein